MSNDRSNQSQLSKTEEKIMQKVLSSEEFKPHAVHNVIHRLEEHISYKRFCLALVPSILAFTPGIFLQEPPDYILSVLQVNNVPFPMTAYFLLCIVIGYILLLFFSDQKVEKLYRKIFKELFQ